MGEAETPIFRVIGSSVGDPVRLFERINFELPLQAPEAVGREPNPSAGVIDTSRPPKAATTRRSLSSGAAKPRPGEIRPRGERP
jgi:hypothetical protein